MLTPHDFIDQADFLRFQQIEPITRQTSRSIRREVVAEMREIVDWEPRKGRWGGRRESNYRIVKAGKVKALQSDPLYYRVLLVVQSTDPERHPLSGVARFYLDESFSPQVIDVEVEAGIAKLVLVVWGAPLVGITLSDETSLEIDLSDDDIEAPKRFKSS